MSMQLAFEFFAGRARHSSIDSTTIERQAPASTTDIEYWCDTARLLERGRFDTIFFADVLAISEGFGGGHDVALWTEPFCTVRPQAWNLRANFILSGKYKLMRRLQHLKSSVPSPSLTHFNLPPVATEMPDCASALNPVYPLLGPSVSTLTWPGTVRNRSGQQATSTARRSCGTQPSIPSDCIYIPI
jgi:hypothetical protein